MAFDFKVPRKYLSYAVGTDGERKKWQGGELHDSYRSPSTIGAIASKIMFWVGHATLRGERRGSYSIAVDKSVGKMPLRRTRPRWENNTNMGVRGVDLSGFS
jgi:hypothetical protein